MKDVHTEHCCLIHGCKYCSEECTVISGEKEQSFKCEECDYQDNQRSVWGSSEINNEPVAIIGRDWQLLWFSPVGIETLAACCERTGLKIGDRLYRHADPSEVERLNMLLRASRSSLDNCALQIEQLQGQLIASDDYKKWYEEAMEASNGAGFAGTSAADVIRQLVNENEELKFILEGLQK